MEITIGSLEYLLTDRCQGTERCALPASLMAVKVGRPYGCFTRALTSSMIWLASGTFTSGGSPAPTTSCELPAGTPTARSGAVAGSDGATGGASSAECGAVR